MSVNRVSMKNITFILISWIEIDAIYFLMSYKIYKKKIFLNFILVVRLVNFRLMACSRNSDSANFVQNGKKIIGVALNYM